MFVVEDSTNSSRFVREEIPGPVIAFIKIKDIKDAISKANDSLGKNGVSTSTSVFTKNKNYIREAGLGLRTYKINVNKASSYMDFYVMHDGKYLVEKLLDKKVLAVY